MRDMSILTTMIRFWNHIIEPLLHALHPVTILQIGGDGDLVKNLATFVKNHNGNLTVIDPFPLFDCGTFQRQWGKTLTLHRTWSMQSLPLCAAPDLVIIDGDHNWYTVFHELTMIEKLAEKSGKFPVILLHDVSWPYARRDSYILPSNIPPEHRQLFAEGGVIPGEDRLIKDGGLNERMFHAITTGGAKNGVLTALEDFLTKTSQEVSVTMLEGFYGLAVIVPTVLRESHAAVGKLLTSLKASSSQEQHLKRVEDARIENLLIAKDLRFSILTMRTQRDWYRKVVDDLSYEKHLKNVEIARREKTLSWRLTMPLRQFGEFFTFLSLRVQVCGILKKIWHIAGEPFPDFVRFVRHQLLRSLFPAAVSPQILQNQEAHEAQDMYGGAVPVSVIVTARNNAPFLRECLESILQQTVKPLEIIYCDDGSDDQSVSIASSLPGIRVLPLTHAGVISARNTAVAESKGDLLLHIDGDDTISPDYLAKQLRALATSNGAAFAYGRSLMFGIQSGEFFHPWDIKRLWTKNFINTSSLVRRSAFEAAGGWQDSVGTLWDWDLWLRMSRIGPGVASEATLNYRRHVGSWSNYERQLGLDGAGLLFGRVRRNVAKVSLCAIVSGRLPELMEPWIDALASTICASASAVNPPELIILDNSTDGMSLRIHKALEKHPGIFRSVLVVPYPVRFSWKSEMERRHMVSKFLATAYNRVLQMADGEIIWFVEDDILVPECAYEILLRDLTDGEMPPAAVSGLYRARHVDELVAHRIEQGTPIAIVDQHQSPLEIDLGGTGCMMAFRPFISHPFTSHWRGSSPAHDWAWCDAIRAEGYRIILDPRVRCRHHQTLTTFV